MCLVYMVNYLYIHFLVYGFVVFPKIAIVQNYPTPSRISPVQNYPTPPILEIFISKKSLKNIKIQTIHSKLRDPIFKDIKEQTILLKVKVLE